MGEKMTCHIIYIMQSTTVTTPSTVHTLDVAERLSRTTVPAARLALLLPLIPYNPSTALVGLVQDVLMSAVPAELDTTEASRGGHEPSRRELHDTWPCMS